jgi:hypothetical protein
MLFLFRFEYHMFYFLYPFVTYLLTPLSNTTPVLPDLLCALTNELCSFDVSVFREIGYQFGPFGDHGRVIFLVNW